MQSVFVPGDHPPRPSPYVQIPEARRYTPMIALLLPMDGTNAHSQSSATQGFQRGDFKVWEEARMRTSGPGPHVTQNQRDIPPRLAQPAETTLSHAPFKATRSCCTTPANLTVALCSSARTQQRRTAINVFISVPQAPLIGDFTPGMCNSRCSESKPVRSLALRARESPPKRLPDYSA
jgi:hypothetical protein